MAKPIIRTCTCCGRIAPAKEFYRRGDRKGSGFQSHCKECVRKKVKESTPPELKKARYQSWRKRYPDAKRNSVLRCTFGIGVIEYNTFFTQQNGCCLICGQHQSKLKRRLAIDHSHDTGKIRGLLCGKCNVGLGQFNDSPILLIKAAQYLQEGCHR